MGVFLTLAVDYEEGSAGTISMLSLHPITAFSYGLLELGRLEDTGVGVTSDTIDSTPNPSGYTFASALRSLIFDSIFFGIISWYLNRVITPDFGQALPWYFPFTAQYWGCHKKTTTDNPTAHALEQTDEDINGSLIPIEGVSDNLRAQSDSNIVIRHLSKKFGGDKTAVDNLNLTMYNGQVTALLGHNGA
jgi:ABC-type multidrug transport system fused ATPase/permease subunit